MKIYIASSLSNTVQVQALRDAFIAAGHTITYDWTSRDESENRLQKLKELALAEIQGVKDADLVVIISDKKCQHSELGMAVALNKNVIIFNQEKKDACPAFYAPNVFIYCSIPPAPPDEHIDFLMEHNYFFRQEKQKL